MKHAYLIMAYNNFDQLCILLKLLDDSRNDIYLHINLLSGEFPEAKLSESVKKASLYIIDRLPVYWGNFSVSEVILSLLKNANSHGNYSYYHLLSGMDLPIKTQNYIHHFFDEFYEEKINFINTYPIGKLPKEWYERVSLHNILTGNFRNENYLIRRGSRLLDKIYRGIQRFLGIDRVKKICEKNNLTIMGGSTWFSITDELTSAIINNEKLIRKIFEKNTIFADEMFVQTIAWMPEFRDKIFDETKIVGDGTGSLRYIDWNRGNPYIWRENDYEQLMKSRYLFARKFDESFDKDIIINIYNTLVMEQ